MSQKKTCYCGTVFMTSIWRKYYCSKACSKEGDRRSKRNAEFIGRLMGEERWKLRDARKDRSGQKLFYQRHKKFLLLQSSISRHTDIFVPLRLIKENYAKYEVIALRVKQ